MAEQCASLAVMAERPDVALHVIPEGANMGLWGGFAMAARDGAVTVCLNAIAARPRRPENGRCGCWRCYRSACWVLAAEAVGDVGGAGEPVSRHM